MKIALLAVAFLSMVSYANASKTSTGTGSFTATSNVVNMRSAGPNTVFDSKVSFTATGFFTGTCDGTSHSVSLLNGRSTSHGSCTFTGSIGDKSGTVIFRLQVTGEGASFQGRFVGGQGSGDLAGAHITGTFQGKGTSVTTSAGTYSANVQFSTS
ncbi:MAG TPA: hypothetical protein VNA15_02985 [Candidatus Angelobacter sp.]|nr:hypothetical protein [Candidatus Angelobacter sp.]